MDVLASKQVGRVAYFVSDIERLISILQSQLIWPSVREVMNPKTKKKQHSVSLTRELKGPPSRNSDKWRFGVVIDGNRLSNRYSIEPYSYVGNAVSSPTRSLRIQSLTLYTDGPVLRLVGFKPVYISRDLYDSLAAKIDSLSETDKLKWKYTYQVAGDRVYRGRRRLEGRLFSTPTGGLSLNSQTLAGVDLSSLYMSDAFDEKEERIWLDDGQSVDLSGGCIVGVVVPTQLDEVEQDLMAEVDEWLRTRAGYPVIYKY